MEKGALTSSDTAPEPNMTIPGERTRAPLWAGSLLIRVSGGTLFPIELRRITTSIARRFPTVKNVEHAATVSVLRDHGAMCEHSRNCPDWQEKSPSPRRPTVRA